MSTLFWMLLFVGGIAALGSGSIMFLPAFSGQADPLLERVAIPSTLEQPPLRYRAFKEQYRGSDLPDCRADTPRLYVTVAEGDRDAMLRIIRHSARRHGGAATFFDDDLCVRHAGSWETALENLNPYVVRDTQRITAGYEVWARNEVIDSPSPSTGDSGNRQSVLFIRVDEDIQGKLSDRQVRGLAISLLVAGILALLLFAARVIDGQ